MAELEAVAEPEFRPMRMKDLAEVLRNETRAYQFPWTAGIFADCIANSEECWAVWLGGDIVGHGILTCGAGEAHVLNVCIGRDHQGSGHGRRLLEFLLQRARARESGIVFLEVRPSNRVARGLYESMGFREVGRRRDYYPASTGNEEACVMALEFT